jgi:hypothetical protein
MEGQAQPLGKKFVLTNGKKIAFPPAHPDCRCTIGEPTGFSKSTAPRLAGRPRDLISETLSEYVPSWMQFGKIVGDIDEVEPGSHAQDVLDLVLQDKRGIGRALLKPPLEIYNYDAPWDMIDEHTRSELSANSATRDILASAIGKLLGVPTPAATWREFAGVSQRVLDRLSGPRRIPGLLEGSVQERVPHTLSLSSIWDGLRVKGINYNFQMDDLRELQASSIFDILTLNPDRHSGNVLVQLPGIDDLSPGEFGRGVAKRVNNAYGHVKAFMIDQSFAFNTIGQPLNEVMTGDFGDSALWDFWVLPTSDPASMHPEFHPMTSDDNDYWVDRLQSGSDRMHALVESAKGLTKREVAGFTDRYSTVLDLLKKQIFMSQYLSWISP